MVGLAAGVGPGGQGVALSSFGLLLAEGDTEGAGKLLSGLVPAVVDRVIFQADLTATAAGEAAPGLRSELDLLADFESGGHATVWRFSQASLRRGFDAGRRAAEIEAFLERHAVHGVPQALSYLVDDMGRRYGKARVGRAASYVRSGRTFPPGRAPNRQAAVQPRPTAPRPNRGSEQRGTTRGGVRPGQSRVPAGQRRTRRHALRQPPAAPPSGPAGDKPGHRARRR